MTETRESCEHGGPGPEQAAVGHFRVESGDPTPPFMGFEELTHLAGKGNRLLLTPAQSVN